MFFFKSSSTNAGGIAQKVKMWIWTKKTPDMPAPARADKQNIPFACDANIPVW